MEKTANDLCQSCGMCCDGTVFPKMNILEKEYHLFKQQQSLQSQPCEHLGKCNVCKIYTERPKICQLYECDVLTEFKKNEISFDEAQEKLKNWKKDLESS